MKKVLQIIKSILIGVFLTLYFTFIILISTLLLNKNDYGVTQFNDKAMILIDEEIANETYKKGSLVIVQEKKINELNIGDEIFVYKTNKTEKTVKITVANVDKINLENNSPYVVLANDKTAWSEEFIAGTTFSVYSDIGGFLSFIESKWVFFGLLIVPCFFILLYEIYLVIITIKFGDIDDEEYQEEVKNKKQKEKSYQDKITSQDEKIEELMKQINELKQEQNKNTKITKTSKKESSEPQKTKTTKK